MKTFDSPHLGINFDLNHLMNRYQEIPDWLEKFSPWLNACHVNDYDGVDEQHWRPGNGLLDWQKIMHKINKLDRDILLIFEYASTLQGRRPETSATFMLREAEKTVFYLEHIDIYRELEQKEVDFALPGNDK